jgi:hypothetical protein
MRAEKGLTKGRGRVKAEKLAVYNVENLLTRSLMRTLESRAAVNWDTGCTCQVVVKIFDSKASFANPAVSTMQFEKIYEFWKGIIEEIRYRYDLKPRVITSKSREVPRATNMRSALFTFVKEAG